MQLLRYLVVKRHNRNGAKGRESHGFQKAVGLLRLNHFWLVGVANLVVSDLKQHSAPRFIKVGELHFKRLHHVLARYALWPSLPSRDYPPSKTLPTITEPRGKLVAKLINRVNSSGV